MGSARRPRRRREEVPEPFFENDHEATTWAIIVAGLTDAGTTVKDVPTVCEVADAIFNEWLVRKEPDDTDDPDDPDDDERED